MSLQKYIALGAVLLGAAVLGTLLIRRWLQHRREAQKHVDEALARGLFQRRREWLEADFCKLAGESGKPRGLIWSDCVFGDRVVFARDRETGELRALSDVTISFEAVVGGGMEEVEAVSNLRAATAVFLYREEIWQTEGRAIFNLNPSEAISHFANELEPVE